MLNKSKKRNSKNDVDFERSPTTETSSCRFAAANRVLLIWELPCL